MLEGLHVLFAFGYWLFIINKIKDGFFLRKTNKKNNSQKPRRSQRRLFYQQFLLKIL